MAVWGDKRRRATVLAALLCFTAILTIAFHDSNADASRHRGPDPTWLILRLSDLPLGYLKFDLQEEQGERIYCSRLTHPDDTPPRMGRFVDRFHPRGCLGAYYRLFSLPGEEPGPKLAATGVLPLQSAKAADAGWAIVPEMLGRLFGLVPTEVAAPEKVGSATRLFHSDDFPRYYRLGRRASVLVWRSGNTLAAIMAVGPSFEADDRAAAELARRQQAHIDKPTRYTLAERFDGEVPLEDPAVDIPVYWLGRNFRPGTGLPDNRLFDSGFSEEATPETHEGFAEGPYAPLNIRYGNIRLGIWTPQTWHVFTASKTSRAITAWKCTRTRTIPLAEGSATIYGGYKKNFRRCPEEEPKAFTAWVDIGGVKVVVNAPFAPDFIETVNPYGSFAGMEAIVRSLVPRPKRAS
jgi:hypothetical protein